MHRNNGWLIAFGLLLLFAMLLTALYGRDSRHGYGQLPPRPLEDRHAT